MPNTEIPEKNKIKKKSKAKDAEKFLTMKDVPAPHQIKAQLDAYVIGQERAKRAVSVAVYNHYKRVILRQDVYKRQLMRSAVTSASSGGLFFILKDLIHKTDKGDNEDTYLEQIRICNVHWHRPPFWRVKPLQCRKGRPPSVL